MEDWQGIAAEVVQAIGEVGFAATLTPAPARPADPWSLMGAAPAPVSVTIIDDGIIDLRVAGSSETRKARMVTIAAIVGVVPQISDVLTVRGRAHNVLAVKPLAPGGVDLMYQLELSL